MPRICYIPKKFNAEHTAIIAHAIRLLQHYVSIGVEVTGRSIYYRFIAMDLLPESWIDPAYNLKHGLPPTTKNTQKNYKRLLSILNDARLAGVIDWDYLRDTLRDVEVPNHWSSPESIIDIVADQYRTDKWADQPRAVEVWAEKDAVEGLLAAVCPRLDVPHFVCRGSPSQTAMWQAGQRIKGYVRKGREPVVLYMGDHDPTGLDITRDITARLELFVGQEVEVVRMALNMDQIDRYNPPPNPAKTTDSRYAAYYAEHGKDSYELDALEPEVMLALIEEQVLQYRDVERYRARERREEKERALLRATSENWQDVVDHLVMIDAVESQEDELDEDDGE